MRCPGCGAGYRKGTLVMLLDPNARKAERRRVCPTCAGGGLTVVAVSQAPVVKKVSLDPTLDGVQKVVRQLATYARAATASAKAEVQGSADAALHWGRAEGFEGAIQLLKGGK